MVCPSPAPTPSLPPCRANGLWPLLKLPACSRLRASAPAAPPAVPAPLHPQGLSCQATSSTKPSLTTPSKVPSPPRSPDSSDSLSTGFTFFTGSSQLLIFYSFILLSFGLFAWHTLAYCLPFQRKKKKVRLREVLKTAQSLPVRCRF